MTIAASLPVHPFTGLRAIALTPKGNPIWPIMGGSVDYDISTLAYSEAVVRMRDAHAHMEQMNSKHRLSRSEEVEFAELGDEFDALAAHVDRLQRTAAMARANDGGCFGFERGASGDYDVDPFGDPRSAGDHRTRFGRDPWDMREVRTFGRDPGSVAAELRERALSAIEHMPGANDAIRQAATEILERFDSSDSKIAKHALITSSPAYMRAWSKMACNRQHTLSTEEQRALAEAEQFRAMSLTDSAGGYLVPFQLDPTVIVTSAGSKNDIRQAARQVIAIGDTWNGVSAANVQWSWDAEATEVSDDSPTFAQPSIPVYKAAGFVPISIEGMQDEQNVTQEVGKLLVGGKDELEAVAFITGSGSGMPTGIVTALVASSPSVITPSATTDTFALADIYSLQGSLPARYRSAASWLSNNLIYNRIRQFDTNGGAGLWTTVGGDRPDRLLGRPVLEAEAVDGVINATQENYVAVFGDFSNYVIADRIGMTVEFIPHLFGASRRPTGQRGWYAYYRVGADSVNDAAFRLFNVT